MQALSKSNSTPHNFSMSQALLERLEIAELVQSWALYRDTGDWDKLRETVHADGTMTATWFHGTFEEFIAAIQDSWRKGSSSQHFQGGTVVQVLGTKAIAQTRMSILLRGKLDAVPVDVNCLGVFYDRVEKRNGQWRIAKRNVIYDKDTLTPVHVGDAIQLSSERLLRFPEGYRHLAYLQSFNGGNVNPELPTARSEASIQLKLEAQQWLRSNP
jgi:hypothetical protein